jgi:hypothetical protein
LDVREVGIQCHQRSALALADFGHVPVRIPPSPWSRTVMASCPASRKLRAISTG